MQAAGCRLKAFFAPRGRSRRRILQGVSGRHPRLRRARHPRRPRGQARRRRRHPRRSRADGGARHARRQGRDARQAGRHLARSARRAAPRPGRDRPHLLDLLFRALHAAGDRRRRRPGQGRRHRPRRLDRRSRTAPHRQLPAARLVLSEGPLWRHPVRHRLAPGRAVPVLHRQHQGRGGVEPGRQFRQSRHARAGRLRPDGARPPTMPPATSASTGSRPTSCPPGATAACSWSAPRAPSNCANMSTSPAGPGEDHLFLVNRDGVRHIDCASTKITYGEQLRDDVNNRTETAMPQAHCFLCHRADPDGAGQRDAHRRQPPGGRAMSKRLKVGVVGGGIGVGPHRGLSRTARPLRGRRLLRHRRGEDRQGRSRTRHCRHDHLVRRAARPRPRHRRHHHAAGPPFLPGNAGAGRPGAMSCSKSRS